MQWLIPRSSKARTCSAALIRPRSTRSSRQDRSGGCRVGHDIEIEIPLLRQDVAELTGTSMFRVSRVLKDWEARGIVDASRRRIVVRQLQALTAIAEKASDLKSRSRPRTEEPVGRLQ